MAIKIDVQSSEIEYDIAGVIVTADTSDESIAIMLDKKDSDVKKRAEKEAEKLKGLKDDDISREEFEAMIQLIKDLYTEIYAPVFGADAFNLVYDKVRSVRSTVNAFDSAIDHMTDEIKKRNEQHDKRKAQKIAKYKNKK